MELYDLQIMVKLVQSVAGHSWKPPSVKLRAKKLPGHLRPEDISAGPIHYALPSTGISIPVNLLALPMSEHRSSRLSACLGKNALQSSEMPDFPTSLRWLMKGYLDENFTIHDLADLVGMNERTLQRRLAKTNTSFRTLMEQTRFEVARDLLSNSAPNIIEVAFDLGYSDPAHFTRAFKRWAGVSPRQFHALRLSPAR